MLQVLLHRKEYSIDFIQQEKKVSYAAMILKYLLSALSGEFSVGRLVVS